MTPSNHEMSSSKLRQTAEKFINHFKTLDAAAVKAIIADDYRHEFAPASINPPGPFDRQGWLEYHSTLGELLVGFPVTVKEYLVSESSNRVTVWATSGITFREDVKDNEDPQEDWSYQGEYVFMFTMDETGEKIRRTVEFLDSKATADRLMPLFNRARENKQKRSASE